MTETPRDLGHWALQDAKARLSEVVRRARRDGPQRVTTRGKNAVVVLREEDYRRLTRKSARRRHVVDVLADGPLDDVDLTRDRETGRDVDL
jgi:prevent-host-death family protein